MNIDANIIKPSKSTIWEQTDGCAEQYRSCAAFFLLSALSQTFDVTIDRAIGAPGHGKDVVDGLNAVDKKYLANMTAKTVTPEQDTSNKKMQAHACTEEQNTSLAAECQRLLSHPSRKDGVTGGSKYNKRNTERKWTQQHYHI